MIRAGLLVLVGLLVAPFAFAQQPAAAIRGRVVAAENDRALRRALITPVERGRRGRPVLSDEAGRFDLRIIARSTSLLVSKAGYVPASIDLPRETPTDGREIEIRMTKAAAITGRIVDASGMPAVGVRVVASPLDRRDVNTSMSYEDETDDLGEYRIGGLAGGHYVVAVTVPGPIVLTPAQRTVATEALRDRRPIPPELFQTPAVPMRPIDVQPRAEVSDVDFHVERSRTSDIVTKGSLSFVGPDARETTQGRTNGESLGGVQVRLAGTAVNLLRVVAANRDGSVLVEGLRDGAYTIITEKSGGPNLTVHVFERTPGPDLEVGLSRGGAIAGEVTDEAGEPFQGVRVQAMQLTRENGRLVAVAAGSALTDDRGRYRVFGLVPGSYVLMTSVDASPSGSDAARNRGFANVYYPGTANLDSAQRLEVEPGRDVVGVDVTFGLSVTARVLGLAVDAEGQPLVGNAQLGLSQRSGAIAIEPRVARIGPDGMFEFGDVATGDYVVQAVGAPGMGRPAEFGAESIVVHDRDPDPIVVKTSPGSTLEGRFVVEGVTDPPIRALSIHAATMDFDRGPAAGRGPDGLGVYDDGRFYLTGLHGTTRFELRNAPDGWYLKSFTLGGVDATDSPFEVGSSAQTYSDAEIVLSPTGATIAGSVTDDTGARASTFTALAFSTNPSLWFAGSRHVKQVRSGANGSFDIRGLPPGDYWVAALDSARSGDWETSEGLGALVPRATRVRVDEGQTRTTALRLARR